MPRARREGGLEHHHYIKGNRNTGDVFPERQMDGEVPKHDLMRALEMGKKALLEIYEVQKRALKEKYHGVEEDAQ